MMHHARAPDTMTVQVIANRADFEECAADWEAAVDRIPGDCVHLRHFWLSRWLDAADEDATLAFRLVRDRDGVVGCGAITQETKGFGSLTIPYLGAAGRPFSKRNPIGFARRADEASAVLLNDLLKERWVWLDTGRVLEGDPILRNLSALSGPTRLQARTDYSLPVVATTLSWHDFLASKSRSFRKRHKPSHLKGRLTVRTYPENFSSVDMLLTAIDFVARRSWSFQNQTSVVSTNSEWTFWKGVIRDAAEQGTLHAACLFHGDDPAAFIFGIREGGTLYAFKTAYVQSNADLSPGRHVFSVFIEAATKNPLVERVDLDCAAPDGSYKLSWATQVKTVRSYYAFRQGLYPELFNQAYRLKKRFAPPAALRPSVEQETA